MDSWVVPLVDEVVAEAWALEVVEGDLGDPAAQLGEVHPLREAEATP